MAKRRSKESQDYSEAVNFDLNKFKYQQSRLYKILQETQKSLNEFSEFQIFPIERTILENVNIICEKSRHPPAIVILGTARARLVNFLLGENVLPLPPKSSNCWRWLRLQYGVKRQITLSLGTEFEIVDPDLPLTGNWDEIPSKNLRRNDTSDLSTVVDIELCNQFLKCGIQILVPPDLGDLSLNGRMHECSHEKVLQDYESFYSKWNSLLDNVFPVVLYALSEEDIALTKISNEYLNKSRNGHCEDYEKYTKNSTFYVDAFTDSYKSKCNPLDMSDLDDSLKYAESCKSESSNGSRLTNISKLSDENMLDLRQIFELHPNARILFVLFSENQNITPTKKSNSSGKQNNDGVKEAIKNLTLSESPTSCVFDNMSLSSSSNSTCQCSSNSSGSFHTCMSNSASSINSTETLSNVSELNTHTDLNSFKKCKNYLDKIIQQLESLSNPFMKKPIIGQGVIVNYSDPQRKSLLKMNEDVKKYLKSLVKIDSKISIAFDRQDFLICFNKFSKSTLQNFLLDDCDKLSEIHHTLLQQFIDSSFDMAREMQIIPKKIQYVAETEKHLYETLSGKFSGEKREELLLIMENVLQNMINQINDTDWTSGYFCHNSTECLNLAAHRSVFYTGNSNNSNRLSFGEDNADSKIRPSLEAELFDLNDYDVLDDTHENLENKWPTDMDMNNGFTNYGEPSRNLDMCSISGIKNSQMSFKQASLDMQRIVLTKLSRNISIQLVGFIDCLRDSYFGTLQRCLDSLEEGRCRRPASEAVRQILLITKTIDLQHYASYSFLHALVEHLRRFFSRLSLLPNNTSCCTRNSRWRRQIALDTVESLSAVKLERIISSQLKEKIRIYHEQFQTSLNTLSMHHSERLHQTEEIKLSIRKLHAPHFARLCLESTSFGDYIRHGLPHLGREIGRGQYGVVFSVKGSWGGYQPCAVKSVIPPDDRHFNELAMEFFQTRNIPEHDRILRIWGSVIDYKYVNGNPSVLLIFERLKWDLHCALMHDMEFEIRMRIAIDIVEGIRFLHSQGLLHRDIKLKNVLLNENNRAKLTDLGFCIPEALMSGSIVGTPIHMAPELLSGFYDNSVDVYAFGILFWYLCSGSVKLPSAYEGLHNKEQLWTHVKRGLRPERLSSFSDTCWLLMEQCWSADPSKRPLLGDVQPILESIKKSQ